MFQLLRGLRSKSGEWGLFLGLRGILCLVPPRVAHLKLTDVPPHLSALSRWGPAPCPRIYPPSSRHSQGREVCGCSSSPGVCCPQNWPDSSPHILATSHRRAKHGAQHFIGTGHARLFSSSSLALILPPSCAFSLSLTAASLGSGFLAPGLPLFTRLGTCFLSLCVSLLSMWLSPASHRSSCSATVLTTPLCMPWPQAKAQTSSGQGGIHGQPPPQLNLQMFPLAFPPSQSLCFSRLLPKQMGPWPRTVEARHLRAGHEESGEGRLGASGRLGSRW